jgi:hypothetical protein
MCQSWFLFFQADGIFFYVCEITLTFLHFYLILSTLYKAYPFNGICSGRKPDHTGKYLVQKASTISGKEFTLLNLPFYMVYRIEQELDKIQSS